MTVRNEIQVEPQQRKELTETKTRARWQAAFSHSLFRSSLERLGLLISTSQASLQQLFRRGIAKTKDMKVPLIRRPVKLAITCTDTNWFHPQTQKLNHNTWTNVWLEERLKRTSNIFSGFKMLILIESKSSINHPNFVYKNVFKTGRNRTYYFPGSACIGYTFISEPFSNISSARHMSLCNCLQLSRQKKN